MTVTSIDYCSIKLYTFIQFSFFMCDIILMWCMHKKKPCQLFHQLTICYLWWGGGGRGGRIWEKWDSVHANHFNIDATSWQWKQQAKSSFVPHIVIAIIHNQGNKATCFALEKFAEFLSHKHITVQDESERWSDVFIL